MKKRSIITTLLVCCFIVCLAVAADLNGKWSGNLVTPDGNTYPLLYEFKVNGENLTGTALAPDGTVTINNGKVKGDEFSFSITTQGMEIPHTGKCYADSIGIDLEINGSKVHSTLKRAQ